MTSSSQRHGRPCRRRLRRIAPDFSPAPIDESLAEIAVINGDDVDPALCRDGYPAPIGGSLAGIAEIIGDVGPVLRRAGHPAPIGESLAETAGTAETPGDRPRTT